MRSIDVIIRELCDAITAGKSAQMSREGKETIEEDGDSPRRRSSRSQFRANDEAASEPQAEEDSPAEPPAPAPADASTT